MTATADLTTSANAKLIGLASGNQLHVDSTGWAKITVSLADLTTVLTAANSGTPTYPASADTYDIIDIPAGTLVENVIIRVMVPAAGTISSMTTTVGDKDAASWIGATDMTAAALTTTIATGAYVQAATAPYGITGGKVYLVDNKVRLTLGGTFTGSTLTAGAVEVLVKMKNLGVSTVI